SGVIGLPELAFGFGRFGFFQGGLHGADHVFGTVGFVDVAEDVIVDSHQVLGEVAAGKQHADVGIDLHHSAQGVVAGHAGHGQVEDYEIDVVPFVLVDFQGLQAVLGNQHVIAGTLQDVGGQVANHGLVVGDEDGGQGVGGGFLFSGP